MKRYAIFPKYSNKSIANSYLINLYFLPLTLEAKSSAPRRKLLVFYAHKNYLLAFCVTKGNKRVSIKKELL